MRYITEDRTLHNHRCENLKFYIILILIRDRPTFRKEHDTMGYHLQFPIIIRPQKVKRCERGGSRSVPDLLTNGGKRGGTNRGRFGQGNRNKSPRKVEISTGRRKELHTDSKRDRERGTAPEAPREDGLSSCFFS
jgi:hypothetical protein